MTPDWSTLKSSWEIQSTRFRPYQDLKGGKGGKSVVYGRLAPKVISMMSARCDSSAEHKLWEVSERGQCFPSVDIMITILYNSQPLFMTFRLTFALSLSLWLAKEPAGAYSPPAVPLDPPANPPPLQAGRAKTIRPSRKHRVCKGFE